MLIDTQNLLDALQEPQNIDAVSVKTYTDEEWGFTAKSKSWFVANYNVVFHDCQSLKHWQL